MEKGMSSGEGLPSRSSQASGAKVTVKELETQQPCKEKQQPCKEKRGGFVLVHAGAGYHSESKAKEYKHVCKRACQKAIEKLQAGALATDAVMAALVELEVYTHSYTSWSCIQPRLYVLLVKRQRKSPLPRVSTSCQGNCAEELYPDWRHLVCLLCCQSIDLLEDRLGGHVHTEKHQTEPR